MAVFIRFIQWERVLPFCRPTARVALELAERGIRVNAICPGGTATWICAPVYPEMPAELVDRTPEIVKPWLASGTPIGRAGLPADIANAALWLASSESSFVTGHALVVDGGFTAGTRWSQTLERLEKSKGTLPGSFGSD
jgi:NAD(P)-dependent dehydrogenase (short-subunit alcohol dehydrogenase family)